MFPRAKLPFVLIATAACTMASAQESQQQTPPPQAVQPSQSAPAASEPDYKTYMAYLQRRIKMQWLAPRGHENDRVVVSFKLDTAGNVHNLVLKQSAGFPQSDKAALQAVQQCSPFRPLPPGSKNMVDIDFTFDNPPRPEEIERAKAQNAANNTQK